MSEEEVKWAAAGTAFVTPSSSPRSLAPGPSGSEAGSTEEVQP